MTHFAVAHHPIRQAHVEPGSGDPRVRIAGVQPVVSRLLGQMHRIEGVLISVGVVTPAIANDEKDRLARVTHEEKR